MSSLSYIIYFLIITKFNWYKFSHDRASEFDVYKAAREQISDNCKNVQIRLNEIWIV